MLWRQQRHRETSDANSVSTTPGGAGRNVGGDESDVNQLRVVSWKVNVSLTRADNGSHFVTLDPRDQSVS